MSRVLLSLGANLDDKASNVKKAMEIISGWDDISSCRTSGLYITKPWGYTDQDDFVNSAMSFESGIAPAALLSRIHALEADFKRRRVIRYGPRTLDIDIICVGSLQMNDAALTIPHPRMAQRAFVLVPLESIEPDFIVPGFDKSVRELCSALPEDELSGVRIMTYEK